MAKLQVRPSADETARLKGDMRVAARPISSIDSSHLKSFVCLNFQDILCSSEQEIQAAAQLL